MPDTIARARTGKQTGGVAAAVQPNVAIVRSAYNAPGTPGFERAYSYSFEAENGIKQEATGELRTVGDADVMVSCYVQFYVICLCYVSMLCYVQYCSVMVLL